MALDRPSKVGSSWVSRQGIDEQGFDAAALERQGQGGAGHPGPGDDHVRVEPGHGQYGTAGGGGGFGVLLTFQDIADRIGGRGNFRGGFAGRGLVAGPGLVAAASAGSSASVSSSFGASVLGAGATAGGVAAAGARVVAGSKATASRAPSAGVVRGVAICSAPVYQPGGSRGSGPRNPRNRPSTAQAARNRATQRRAGGV